jgi:hypothetical protein
MDQLDPDRKDPDPDLNSPPAAPPPEAPPPAGDAAPTGDTAPIGDPTPNESTAAFDAAAVDADAAADTHTAVDTDTAVQTEVVETPPVKAFVPEPPTGRRRIGGRLSVFVALLAILAIGGVAAFGYTLNQELNATRANVASTESELGSTKSTLDTTKGQLDTTSTTLTAAKTERATLDAQVADLASQVSSQAKCVGLQAAALEELTRISDLQTVNNNRTGAASTWDKAERKRSKAVSDALNAYYQAYSKAFDRNLTSARAWAAKGKEYVNIVAVQAKQQLAEFALIDRSAKEIETAIDALEKQLKSTETTCKAVN